MEQLLAYKKAKLSGLRLVISEARKVSDLVEAKKILHRLQEDHPHEWKRDVAEVAAEGIRAKFTQDPYLLDQLLATTPKQLVEASTTINYNKADVPQAKKEKAAYITDKIGDAPPKEVGKNVNGQSNSLKLQKETSQQSTEKQKNTSLPCKEKKDKKSAKKDMPTKAS